MHDRRADSRAEIDVEVNYRTAQEFLAAYSKNISGGGIFIRTAQPHPLNQKVLVRFTLPGVNHKFEVHGMVVWANSATGRTSFPSGMGIKFLELNADDSKLITEFLNKARPPAPTPPAAPSS